MAQNCICALGCGRTLPGVELEGQYGVHPKAERRVWLKPGGSLGPVRNSISLSNGPEFEGVTALNLSIFQIDSLSVAHFQKSRSLQNA